MDVRTSNGTCCHGLGQKLASLAAYIRQKTAPGIEDCIRSCNLIARTLIGGNNLSIITKIRTSTDWQPMCSKTAMAWKATFDKGVACFKSGQLDEALAHINQVSSNIDAL